MTETFDLIVVGSGPGGYVAAIRAGQLGLKAACVEKQGIGGTCLNVGCIPSKALLQASEHYAWVQKEAEEFGIHCKGVSFDWDKMKARKDEIIKSFQGGIRGLFKKNKVTSLVGTGTLEGPNQVSVTDEKGKSTVYQAKHILLATGSQSVNLPFLPIDEKRIVTSTGALSLDKVPKRLLVVGGGVIGVELASVYNRLGSDVKVVEMLDSICPGVDEVVSKGLQRCLQNQGMEFHLSSQVLSADVKKKDITLSVKKGDEEVSLSADVVLVCVGRKPFSEGLGLEKVGLSTLPNGCVEVDDCFHTKVPSILAIGDLIPGPMLAHRASEEAVAAVEYLAGKKPHCNYMAIPNVIYTYPEAASVGLTEKEAREMGCEIRTGSFSFRGNSRARCSGDTEGLVKIVEDKKTGTLLGMHILGAHAGELIAEGILAIEKKAKVSEIAAAPHAHPTLSEAIKEAALDVEKSAIHA